MGRRNIGRMNGEDMLLAIGVLFLFLISTAGISHVLSYRVRDQTVFRSRRMEPISNAHSELEKCCCLRQPAFCLQNVK